MSSRPDLAAGMRVHVPLIIAIPLGALVVIGGTAFGFSRILLSLEKEAATAVALMMAAALTMGALATVASAAEASQQTADTVQPSITRVNSTWNTFVFDDLTDSWTNISFESQCSG